MYRQFLLGGGEPFGQKLILSCPNINETVEKKQGYDALKLAFIWSKNIQNILTFESVISTAKEINDTIYFIGWLQTWHIPFQC